MKKHLFKTFLLGIYAGLAIAFGGLLNIFANFLLFDFPVWAKLVGSALFPVGLILVCFLGFNLFTGKIGYVFDNKKGYLLDLLIMYIGNFVGSFIAGAGCILSFKNLPDFYSICIRIATKKTGITDFSSGMNVFLGAVLCGALVYIAVFCFKNLKNKALKVVGIFVPIAVFVYFGFDHCVANMFYFTFAFSYSNPIMYLNILLATIGNSVGAIALNEGIKAFKLLLKNNKAKENA